MRRDVFHYFPASVEKTFAAYCTAVKRPPFDETPNIQQNRLISYRLGFSFRFNMNGGAINIHFAPKDGGTAVQIRFTIVQLMGARYGAYDDILTKNVESLLGEKAQRLDSMPDSYFDSPQPSQQNNEMASISESLREAKQLLDDGIITEEEYAEIKQTLLNKIK